MIEAGVRERRKYLSEMARNLELLEHDFERKKKGWTILRFVDFATIHAYVYGSGADYEHSASSISEFRHSQTFARQQVALELLFSTRYRPFGLLPSYTSEMTSHVRTIRSQASLAQHLLIKGKEQRKRLVTILRDSDEFKQFWSLHIANKASVDDAVALAQKFFPEILTVVKTLSGDVISSLSKLLKDGTLVEAEKLYPAGFAVSPSQEAVGKWFGEIVSRRSNERQYASLIDALACAFLEEAQPSFYEAKVVLQFISPSTIITSLLESSSRVMGRFRGPPVTRSYDYYLLATALEGRQDQLRSLRREIDALRRVYENVARSVDADKWLLGTENKWREVENLSLVVDADFAQVVRNPRPQRQFEQVVYSLLLAAEDNPDAFDERALDIVSRFQREMEVFSRLLPEDKARESIRGFFADPSANPRWMMLPSLDDDFPIGLQLKAESLHSYATYLKQLPSEQSRDELRTSAASLIASVMSEADEERYLFAAYLCALAHNYEEAVALLSQGLNNASAVGTIEMSYLLAVIYRHTHNEMEAGRVLDRALLLDHSDPRLLLELAAVEWLKAHYRTEDPNQWAQHVKDAISTTRRALEFAAREPAYGNALIMRAHNALAFLYTELALNSTHDRLQCLEEAEQHVAELVSQVSPHEWHGRVLDTMGWFRYAKAILSASADRADLLNAAAADVQSALRTEKLEKRRRLLQEHHEAILRALEQA